MPLEMRYQSFKAPEKIRGESRGKKPRETGPARRARPRTQQDLQGLWQTRPLVRRPRARERQGR
eukprot:3831843-Lingulodinium_polyedra.AAC.1